MTDAHARTLADEPIGAADVTNERYENTGESRYYQQAGRVHTGGELPPTGVEGRCTVCACELCHQQRFRGKRCTASS